jgi:hypothetical protein
MLDNDQTRNRTSSTDPSRRAAGRTDTGMGGMILAAMAAIAIIAALFMWAPWSGPKIANNNAPGTTVGSSTTRPATPAAPASPATTPAAPAAPSTTR